MLAELTGFTRAIGRHTAA